MSHLKEIKFLIGKMDLERNEVAVFTRDDETNTLGSGDIGSARVLFLTQQMIDSRLSDGKQFKDLNFFHFRGQPRQVKIWDESMLPAEELTLNVDALACLPSLLRGLCSPLADKIHVICQEVRSSEDHTTYEFPDLVGEFGFDYENARAGFSKERPRDREAARTLSLLSGKSVRVRRDVRGNTLLDYRNHLPQDFFPLVILDASGRVRTTYENWRKDRGNLVILATAIKRYDKLSIHVWNKCGGKSAFRNQSSDLIEGIAATINTKPTEQWLVILHKEDECRGGRNRIPDLMKHLDDLLNIPENVSSLTWGNEKATNQYADFRNVILAGTLFYPKSTYELRARASKGLNPNDELDFESYKALEMGEHKNLILQAACRGSVRKCVGDQGGAMDLYLIASNKTGIPYILNEIFPGAKLEEWEPVERPLRGKVGEAVAYIKEYFNNWKNGFKPLSFTEVTEAIGISHRQNFNQDIRKHQDFKAALAKLNVGECSLNKSARLTHFRLL